MSVVAQRKNKCIVATIVFIPDVIQGVQDQKCQKEKARTWKGSIFDPTLVKPKWV